MATAYQWGRASGEAQFPSALRQHRASPSAARISPPNKRPECVEFYTIKRIDNSRLVRHVEPVRVRNFYKTVSLGMVVAAFCMLYVYQHFRCIDLGFQLEDFKGKTLQAQTLNSKLKLEIACLRDPRRIDVIARRQLGLTQANPAQVREYTAADGAEVAAVQLVRPNRAP